MLRNLRENMHRPFSTALVLCLIILLTFNMSLMITVWISSRNIRQTAIIDLDAIRFQKYMVQFNKSYSDPEYKRRLRNFKVSLGEIARLNSLEGHQVFGLTQFSDMSAEEFAKQMLMKRNGNTCQSLNIDCKKFMVNKTSSPFVARRWDNMTVPDKFDWRIEGYVSPVLNQDACRACWSISVVGVMETMTSKQELAPYARIPLSAQELLDCSEYNEGCSGGRVVTALEYICRKKLGIVSEQNYPLTLKDENCRVELDGGGVTVKDFKYHCNMDKDEILRTIVHHGPVTAVVNAAPWYNYIGGVIRRACVRNENSYLHAIMIVGYDKTAEVPHFILKNSWGKLFGDKGYVKVAMDGNVCGIREEIGEFTVKMQ